MSPFFKLDALLASESKIIYIFATSKHNAHYTKVCQLPVENKLKLSSKGLAFILDQINRSVFTASFTEGLNPAQWGAVRFLAHARPSQRTVSGFADFQATTAGTASRTLASLEKKGLAYKERHPEDHRSFQINLTQEGQALLDKDPLKVLENAIESLPEETVEQLANGLEGVIRKISTTS